MRRMIGRFTILLLILTACCAAAQSTVSLGADVTDFSDRVADGDWHPAVTAAIEEMPSGGALVFPAGEYRFDEPLDLQGKITLLLSPGARVVGVGEDVIRIVGDGDITIRGLGGRPELANESTADPEVNERGVPEGTVSSVISLNHVPMEARPNLRVEGVKLTGFVCIEGMRVEEKGPMGTLEVLDCHLEAEDMHLTHQHSEVHDLRVENSLFTGDARYGIYATSPMPGGAIVRGNVLRNVGIRAIQLSGGYVNMIADGAVEYLPSAIVHDNQVLGGGHLARVTTSYILGILVYGHNVSMQNNIVRDFNRGEPVPDERIGHHMQMPDGEYFRGIWIETEDDPRRRLAGAALYAKARQAIISGNICTNSGWRSVIEVKTGGREPHVMVSNNIVDGRSLSIEGSFGFECGSNRSVWANNLVYNMPDIAFAVRGGGRQNTYTNNTIFGAKTAFSVGGGSAGRDELIMNNRFVDVETQVSSVHDYMGAARAHTLPPLLVPQQDAMPEASEDLRGQIAVLLSPDDDRVLVCKLIDGGYAWTEATTGEIAGGLLIQGAEIERIGPELAINPDQSRDGPAEGETWPDSARSFPFGWSASAPGVEVSDVMVYDEEQFETGARSLRIGEGDERFNYVLSQRIPVTPGKTYLLQARAKTNNPEEMSFSLYTTLGERRLSSADAPGADWTTISMLVKVPEDAPEVAEFRLWGSGAGDGNLVWIDSVSMYEAQIGQ
ncbi:MAG: carbohydrate binding domain-containing protein [Armatimonadota bacterium]